MKQAHAHLVILDFSKPRLAHKHATRAPQTQPQRQQLQPRFLRVSAQRFTSARLVDRVLCATAMATQPHAIKQRAPARAAQHIPRASNAKPAFLGTMEIPLTVVRARLVLATSTQTAIKHRARATRATATLLARIANRVLPVTLATRSTGARARHALAICTVAHATRSLGFVLAAQQTPQDNTANCALVASLVTRQTAAVAFLVHAMDTQQRVTTTACVLAALHIPQEATVNLAPLVIALGCCVFLPDF